MLGRVGAPGLGTWGGCRWDREVHLEDCSGVHAAFQSFCMQHGGISGHHGEEQEKELVLPNFENCNSLLSSFTLNMPGHLASSFHWPPDLDSVRGDLGTSLLPASNLVHSSGLLSPSHGLHPSKGSLVGSPCSSPCSEDQRPRTGTLTFLGFQMLSRVLVQN